MAKDVAAPWHIHGKNTASYEHYIVDGNQAASPFRFDDEQIFDEFNINLDRRISPYERWQGQIFGVLNGSSYRSNEGGFVPERLSLFREKEIPPSPPGTGRRLLWLFQFPHPAKFA